MKLIFKKTKNRLRRFLRKHLGGELSPDEKWRKKQQEDYDYLKSHGVETELGYVTLYGKPIIYKEPGSVIRMRKMLYWFRIQRKIWQG